MADDLLQLAADVAGECGIPVPSSVVGSTNKAATRILRMSEREGKFLAREHDWTILTRLHTFTTVISQAEYALPSDYGHLLRDTEWDRTEARPLFGPLTPQQWQAIKSGLVGSGIVNRHFRIMRSASSPARKVHVDPTPTVAGDTLAFEYVSKHWCADSGLSTPADRWAADTDVPLVDYDLLVLGTIVRFKRSVGLDYASEADEYAQLSAMYKGQDRPSPNVNLAQQSNLRLLNWTNLPETGITG